VPTGVQKDVDLVLPVAGEDDLFFAHLRNHEVTRVGHLCFVTDEEPRTSEDLFHLLLVDVLVDVDRAVDRPLLEVNERPK
jgi:hypothetical protein